MILKPEEVEALEKLHKNSANNTVRKRSQCLLLSNKKTTIIVLSGIFDVNRRTIERWFDSWPKKTAPVLFQFNLAEGLKLN